MFCSNKKMGRGKSAFTWTSKIDSIRRFEVNITEYGLGWTNNGADTLGNHDGWYQFGSGKNIKRVQSKILLLWEHRHILFNAGTKINDRSLMIPPFGAHVVCHASASNFVLELCDYTFWRISNGNDAICLSKGTETDHTILDCFGNYGPDPGTAWLVR